MMAKEIDRVGIPVVQICTIVPIAETVGSNRIVKAEAIPWPVGNPNVSLEKEHEIREHIMEEARKSLTQNVAP